MSDKKKKKEQVEKPWYIKLREIILVAVVYVVIENTISQTIGKSVTGSTILYICALILVVVQVFS